MLSKRRNHNRTCSANQSSIEFGRQLLIVRGQLDPAGLPTCSLGQVQVPVKVFDMRLPHSAVGADLSDPNSPFLDDQSGRFTLGGK